MRLEVTRRTDAATTGLGEIEHYHVFDTAIGRMGLAWSTLALTRLSLPERDECALACRLGADHRMPAAILPDWVADLVGALKRYAEGSREEFADVPLDLEGMGEFRRRIYEATRRVGYGELVSYGELARRLEEPGAARAVGQAMAQNPLPIVIPCHRVVGSAGKPGGFSAHGGLAAKERLLALEGRSLAAPAPLLDWRPA
ncbi:MAG: methylated-DNA--[protein]-cysteine S-methyltransferase [Hyphomicrobiaceae bacterium]|nr:MAG: methylated-DNA--[protein]-cysteine S-methyltransferase [Hyphomicrobiaceae bacterium]